MAKSVEEQLAEVQASIADVMDRGQRQTMKDREIWRPDVSVLLKEQERLERAVANKANGGRRIQRIIPL